MTHPLRAAGERFDFLGPEPLPSSCKLLFSWILFVIQPLPASARAGLLDNEQGVPGVAEASCTKPWLGASWAPNKARVCWHLPLWIPAMLLPAHLSLLPASCLSATRSTWLILRDMGRTGGTWTPSVQRRSPAAPKGCQGGDIPALGRSESHADPATGAPLGNLTLYFHPCSRHA